MPGDATKRLQSIVDRLKAGDAAARDELINAACQRLSRLVHRLFGDFRRLERWIDVDDVAQESMIRLSKALEAVDVSDVRHFFRLAAQQIRRTLIDLSRHYFGPLGVAQLHATPVSQPDVSDASLLRPREPGSRTHDPAELHVWTQLHEQVERLPEDERNVFDLCWYHEMSQVEAAEALGVSIPTIKRRWLRARLRLQQYLSEE